ncbi:HYExAFE family protein [Fimbriiglobus ruber]|uniref:Uncharacterized protein n=1 Tax=Fimbriiglobus ruber TaxID=1908690 RepID=A0A225E9V9_9BACT|nr:HYExAFE family protein [Fimbriiglobus ruber]OWK46816.1 hypothetical protein FRUB_00515 [Fimbriiglobus ruber]
MDRSNHYEAAFEAYLRGRGVGCVPVDEGKRSVLGGAGVKSADFIVVGEGSAKLVVDVKGRRFPGGSSQNPRKIWQTWTMQEDAASVARWASHFGSEFRGILAFVYHVVAPFRLSDGTPDSFTFRDRHYLIRAVAADDYCAHMRPRSSRWGTVHLSTGDFRRVVRPFGQFLRPHPETYLAGADAGARRMTPAAIIE